MAIELQDAVLAVFSRCRPFEASGASKQGFDCVKADTNGFGWEIPR